MKIEGRKKNEYPKVMKELTIYILLMSEYSFLRDKSLSFFHITERTLYRYIHDLELLLDYPICQIGSVQKEFHLINTDEEEDPLYCESDMLMPHLKESVQIDQHLARLYRLMKLYYMADDLFWDIRVDLRDSIADTNIEWVPIATALDIYREDPTIGSLSRRTIERDLKLLHDTIKYVVQYDDFI